MSLDLEWLRVQNLKRMKLWHGQTDWSVSDWAVAMAGESGEVCNAVKKLRRVEDRLATINDPGRQIETREQAIKVIGEEIADTLIYLDLLSAKLNLDLGELVIEKFNKTSDKYKFDIYLD